MPEVIRIDRGGLMESLGSQVHVIDKPDAADGFLGARIDFVRSLCASDDRYVWLDQYTNPENWGAHYRRTAPAIAHQFPQLDESYVDEVVRVEEADTVRTCHRLARSGFLLGGSTGTVVSGAISWLAVYETPRPRRGGRRLPDSLTMQRWGTRCSG